MKPLLLLCCLFVCHSLSFAQQTVEVKYEADSKGNYRFFCENNGYCTYIVEVSFTDLQNLRADLRLPYVGEVRPGSNSLFTLAKENPGGVSNFRFSYRYVKGCIQPKVDMGHTYLLPVAPGKEVQAREMDYFLHRYMNEPAPQDWYALGLKMKAGDTVYASRRGTVTEVKDDANLNQSGYAMASGDNYIEVYHDDCSFARYQVLKEKSIFVKPGQFLEAGDAIGIVGGEKYLMGPHLRFCVYYTLDKDAFTDYDKAGRRSRLAYVPVQFWTKEAGKQKLANDGTYTSEHPTAIITQGMSKKDVKKWTEKHKN